MASIAGVPSGIQVATLSKSTHALLATKYLAAPPYDRTLRLAQASVEGAAWLCRGFTLQQLVDEMIPFIYKQPMNIPEGSPMHDYSGPHDIAAVFLACAIGTLIERATTRTKPEKANTIIISQGPRYVLEKPSMVTTSFIIQIGLDRDSARWGLKETDVQRQRVLFWDIFIGDDGRFVQSIQEYTESHLF
ncbi:hypothetical protein BC835DRAFT_1418942 [Cytidiella melzeri]|nr:hypothetical protein BC835DRAFT_1418942 [Cytidiella melzeri]